MDSCFKTLQRCSGWGLVIALAFLIPAQAAPTQAGMEAEFPSHWRVSQLAEPFYGGNIRVVEAGDPAKPPLLLIHGLGQNGLADWRGLMVEFEQDYHLISFDLPGFGGSSATLAQLSPARYAELVHWVIQQKTQQAVTVVGHSMGAAISLRYAANFPQQLSKLIMVDTAGILQRTVFTRYLAQMPADYQWMQAVRAHTSLLDKALTRFNRFSDRITSRLLAGLDTLPDPAELLLSLPQAQQYIYKDRANLNAALGLIYEDFSDAIARVNVPTHIIWGQQDKVAPLRTGQLLAGQMQQAQLHVIPGAGHVPMSDSQASFMQLFQQALHLVPEPASRQAVIASERDFNCNNQHERQVQGHYRVIRIVNCHYLQLQDVTAEAIHIDNSIVSMRNVQVSSPTTALTVHKSALTLTNVELRGKVALHTSQSQLDAAGVALHGSDSALQTEAENALYFSVSRMSQPGSERVLHGYSLGERFSLQ